MIKADFLVNPQGMIIGFIVDGHADFAESGADIVCSAVSSAAYMAANMITEILAVTPITVRAEDGYMILRIEEKDTKTCRDIFEALKMHLLSLEEQYSGYILVTYVEV